MENITENNLSENNFAEVSGVVSTQPVITHEKSGESFYEFAVSVERNSGTEDYIPICISERLFQNGGLPQVGGRFSAVGQFRSYNKFNEKTKRNSLILSFFVRRLKEECKNNINSLKLIGYVCKPPIYRSTPFNREICDILVAVNRPFDKSDYIPCIAWGRNAKFVSGMRVGTKLEMEGRIQSRLYQKQEEGEENPVQKMAYEISLASVKKLEGEKEGQISYIN